MVTAGGPAARNAGRLGAAAAPSAFTNVVQDQAGHNHVYNVTDPASVNELVLGTADTVNASAGLSTIFGLNADLVNAASGVFFGGASTDIGVASTIIGGAGASTVFATTAVQFNLGTSQDNLFVGGVAASTINAGAGGGSFFGGVQGDDFNLGTGQLTFVGLGGTDTINGGAGSATPTIFALNAEHLALSATTKPVTIVSFANEGVIDASKTAGNNLIFAGYGIGGNQTLLGSTAGFGVGDSFGATVHDVYVIGAASTGSAASMISIGNFLPGDVFYLTGFTAADITTMDTAIRNSAGRAAGDITFTLSDKTTIHFAGNHPTNFFANAAF